MFQNTFFTEHFWTTAFEYPNNIPRAFETKYEKNEGNDIPNTYL